MSQERTIFHVDMDAFFASCEIAENPSLKGKPLIIGRRVVSTCSYEARVYGVHSAMSMFEAERLCPHAIFLDGNYDLYGNYSAEVMDILRSITPVVQVVGIDEAYLDVSLIAASPMELAKALRRRVFDQTKLTCSVGVATNKLVAKIASSLAKPNGIYEIPPGLEPAFLATLPVGKIHGIGPKTAKFFYHEGIDTIADLQKLTLDQMIQTYGMRGYHYYHLARGYDTRPVISEDEAPKQVGAEVTFEKDLSDLSSILEHLEVVVEKAYRRLSRENMLARGLTLKLRTHDFQTCTRSMTFPSHTKNYQTLRRLASELLQSSWSLEPLRLIGVAFDKLTDTYWQPLLFEWEETSKGS